MKIAFVIMPFASVSRPSLGPSLLQAALRRDGHECDLHYFNLDFAKQIGVDVYQQFAQFAPQESLAGEWVFSETLFGLRANGYEWERSRYLQEVLLARHGDWFTLPRVLQLFGMRDVAGDFVDKCLQALDWSRYDLVGFTSMFQQNVASLALAKRIKAAHPGVLIAMGGANCEAEMGTELHRQFSFLDFVCSGEGDINVPELVRRLSDCEPTSGIDGVITRGFEGETVTPHSLVSPIEDLDSLPVPRYGDYFDQRRELGLEAEIDPWIPIETSRGCWWGAKHHCTFCGLNGSTMKFRSKSPERALAEIEELGKKYGKRFFAVDLILDLHYLDTVMPELVRRERGYTFFYESKSNLKRNQMKMLADAGVVELQPGIESLSTSVLKLMRKGCTALQNIQCLKWGREFGVGITWNLIFGFPGEDRGEYEKVAAIVPLLRHLDPPEACAKVRFDRFSPYFETPEQFGLTNLRPDEAYAHVYPFPQEALTRLAYFFRFDHAQDDRIAEYTEGAKEEVMAWQESAGVYLLEAEDDGDELLIRDDRFGESVTYRLADPLRAMLLFCDEARSFSAITRRFPERSDAELRALIEELSARRILLREDDHFLSLVLLACPAVEFAEAARDSSIPIFLPVLTG